MTFKYQTFNSVVTRLPSIHSQSPAISHSHNLVFWTLSTARYAVSTFLLLRLRVISWYWVRNENPRLWSQPAVSYYAFWQQFCFCVFLAIHLWWCLQKLLLSWQEGGYVSIIPGLLGSYPCTESIQSEAEVYMQQAQEWREEPKMLDSGSLAKVSNKGVTNLSTP